MTLSLGGGGCYLRQDAAIGPVKLWFENGSEEFGE